MYVYSFRSNIIYNISPVTSAMTLQSTHFGKQIAGHIYLCHTDASTIQMRKNDALEYSIWYEAWHNICMTWFQWPIVYLSLPVRYDDGQSQPACWYTARWDSMGLKISKARKDQTTGGRGPDFLPFITSINISSMIIIIFIMASTTSVVEGVFRSFTK